MLGRHDGQQVRTWRVLQESLATMLSLHPIATREAWQLGINTGANKQKATPKCISSNSHRSKSSTKLDRMNFKMILKILKK